MVGHLIRPSPQNMGTHTHTHAYARKHMHTIHTHTHSHTHTHTHTHTICTHNTHMYTLCTYTHTHTHMPVHMHTHKNTTRQQKTATYLFGQLFLTEFVQSEELSGQDDVVNETHCSQLHTDDDLSVWHHHGHSTEVDLEVFRQLLTTSVARSLWKTNKITTSCANHPAI